MKNIQNGIHITAPSAQPHGSARLILKYRIYVRPYVISVDTRTHLHGWRKRLHRRKQEARSRFGVLKTAVVQRVSFPAIDVSRYIYRPIHDSRSKTGCVQLNSYGWTSVIFNVAGGSCSISRRTESTCSWRRKTLCGDHRRC